MEAGGESSGAEKNERNSPAEALGNHTVPHSGATCSEGASEKGAGLEDCKDW